MQLFELDVEGMMACSIASLRCYQRADSTRVSAEYFASIVLDSVFAGDVDEIVDRAAHQTCVPRTLTFRLQIRTGIVVVRQSRRAETDSLISRRIDQRTRAPDDYEGRGEATLDVRWNLGNS
ncbi:MAG TPA: hypothetical protein VIV60_29765 [Polyangiaceae bacterium]